jgi:uncharacterized peroxidase-related enzyme
LNAGPICRVNFVPQNEAEGALREAYDAVAGPDGKVHNLYLAMALSPQAIEPADQLYKTLLHNDDCPLEPWLRELISTQVAIICDSAYAAVNHGENFHDSYGDPAASEKIIEAISNRSWKDDVADEQLCTILEFNDILARTPHLINDQNIESLREAGLSDKQIVYLVQISASFAYWARVINGLGINLGDEPIGLARKKLQGGNS